MIDREPPLECYIVAKHEGRRILIPISGAELTMTYEAPTPWDRDPRTYRNAPTQVTLTGFTREWRIWEDGANPETFNPDRPELSEPQRAIESLTTPPEATR